MLLIGLYLTAIVLANLTTSWWGPDWSIVNAFLFIGLDLTARDGLHDSWHRRHLAPKMAALIAAGSLLSWLLNADASKIALASFFAFAAAGVVDAVVYHYNRHRPREERINRSNIPAAIVDSTIFPLVAFGFPFLWTIAIGQATAKIVGGAMWAKILGRRQ
jgi:hypothetical protein